jgi:Concanavalin A-like lectin/glucanases superfamily
MSCKAPLSYLCAFLAQLLLLLSIGTIVRAQSPIGHWEFNDGSGTTLSDSSGKGHPAVLFNGVTRGSGRVGAGVTANATLSQFVYIPSVDLSRTNAATVAFWAKRTYSKAGGHVLFEASDNYNKSTEGFVFLPDDDTCQGIQIGLRGNVGYTASCYGQPSSQVWHHLAVVFDKSQTGGDAIAFYVDGNIQTATRSLSASTNTNNFGDEPIYLFSRGGTTQFDSGTIDDFRIYGSALPAAKVQQSYLSGLSQIGKDVVVYVDGAGTMTTPSFTTSSNGELLVAFVASDGPASSGQTATVSGGGLTWTLRARGNKQWGTAEIWSAAAPNAPFTATVTSQPGGGGGYHGSLTVVGFTNASGIGKAGQASAPSGAPDITLAGIAAGSWVFAVGNDWDNPIARTPVSGQVLVHQRVDTQVGDTYWVQSTAAPSLVSGSVDIHDSAPTSDQWNYAAVEIVAKQVATYSISGTISGVGGTGATVNLTGASAASTTADSGGNYTFSGLANGSYTVTPSKTGYVYTPASQAVTVNGANVSAVNFGSTTAPTYSISGTISGVGGPAATVKLTGTGSASTTADSGGNYTFSGFANGSYTVTPSKTGYIYTPPSKAVTVNGANVSAVNFSSAGQTYSISGTISGAGGPGATVNLTGALTASTTADSGGNYTFSGLVNGSYTVTPSKTGYIYTPPSKAVTVNGASVTAVSFSSTAQAYSISGTISGAGGPSATVNLTGTATASTTADSGGNYTFSGLVNGSYTVTPSKTGYIYTPPSKAVTVNGANVSAVNFTSAVVSHWVGLSWTASTSQVVGYNAYRSTTSNGTYTKLNSVLVTSTTYSDQNVQSGLSYYYVTTAVDSQGNESVYSNQAVATVP